MQIGITVKILLFKKITCYVSINLLILRGCGKRYFLNCLLEDDEEV